MFGIGYGSTSTQPSVMFYRSIYPCIPVLLGLSDIKIALITDLEQALLY